MKTEESVYLPQNIWPISCIVIYRANYKLLVFWDPPHELGVSQTANTRNKGVNCIWLCIWWLHIWLFIFDGYKSDISYFNHQIYNHEVRTIKYINNYVTIRYVTLKYVTIKYVHNHKKRNLMFTYFMFTQLMFTY